MWQSCSASSQDLPGLKRWCCKFRNHISWVTWYKAWLKAFHYCRWMYLYCLFSYLTLLALQYGGRVWRTWVALEWAGESRISIRESEWRMDVGLFLNEYPWWELATSHQLVILHEMFLHATKRGQKEAECMFCQGHHGSMCDPNSKGGQPTIELAGYHMSWKEIRDIYQSVYLLWRAPSLPSCGDELRRKAIQDILSSLKDWLHRCGHPAATRDPELQEERLFRPNQWESYEEALRAAHQKALDTTEALRGNIEGLSQRGRERSWTHSRTCSQTHSQSRSHSGSRSWSRSCSRAHSQNHTQGSTQSVHPRSPDGPLPRRRVTFRNPEVETSPKGDVEDYFMEPSVSDVEMWLEWQAWQLGTPTWWTELKAIPGIKDPWKLALKIRASFYIPEVRMRVLLEPEYTAPPAPKSLNKNAFLPDELPYQDMWQQQALLTIAYARSLQYWVEKCSPPKSLDLHPLVGSVVQLRETVGEHVTFNHQDVVWGLGETHLASTSHGPHTTIFSCMLSLLGEEQEFRKATTHATSPVAEEDMAECTAPPTRTERENPYLLVITASVACSTWDQVVIMPEGPQLREMYSGTRGWQPPLQHLPGQSVMEALL